MTTLEQLKARSQRMEMALKAVLLFYSIEWNEHQIEEWTRISRTLLSITDETSRGATTKTLCDMVRAALKEDV